MPGVRRVGSPLVLLLVAWSALGCSVDADSGAPVAATLPPAVERATGSTVLVEGTACRVSVRGSGFVVAPGLVATAAHVVTGVERPSIRTADGDVTPARLVALDPARDLALLRIEPQTDVGPPLDRREPVPVEDAVVLGRDEAGDLHPASVRVVDAILARGPDIHGEGSSIRQIAVLEGDLGQGDSGAPVVGEDGAVLGVVVAVSAERPLTAYAVRPAELTTVIEGITGDPVAPGPCRQAGS